MLSTYTGQYSIAGGGQGSSCLCVCVCALLCLFVLQIAGSYCQAAALALALATALALAVAFVAGNYRALKCRLQWTASHAAAGGGGSRNCGQTWLQMRNLIASRSAQQSNKTK